MTTIQQARAQHRRLLDERSQLRMRLTEMQTRWWDGGGPDRIVKADLQQQIEKNAIALRHTEYLIERLRERHRRQLETARSGRQWSDEMVAAIIHICETTGHAWIPKAAKKLVADGWPKAQECDENTTKISLCQRPPIRGRTSVRLLEN